MRRHGRTHSRWFARAVWRARDIAQKQTTFTSEDVWKVLVGRRPNEPRAMGQVFALLHREGTAKPTGEFIESKRNSRHKGPVRVWRSRLV